MLSYVMKFLRLHNSETYLFSCVNQKNSLKAKINHFIVISNK